MKTCLNIRCRQPFEPARVTQKYCCSECGKEQSQRNWVSKNKEKVYKKIEKWREENPEKSRLSKAKSVAKSYVTKKLPDWMYS